MPKVRIRSGSQTGAVVEMSVTEAEVNVAFGTAEYVTDEAPPAPAAPPAEVERSRARRTGKESTDKDEA